MTAMLTCAQALVVYPQKTHNYSSGDKVVKVSFMAVPKDILTYLWRPPLLFD
jgi:hypothetical protein